MKRFPFDTNNLIAYLVAFIVEYILIGYEYLLASCILALGIGVYGFVISLTKDIQRILYLINGKIQENQADQLNELKILFSEFSDFHGAAKQLSISDSY